MPTSLADDLTAALPHLTARWGRRVVVKLGGSVMEHKKALTAVLQDLVLLQVLGQRLAVVHGGGKAIDRALTKVGIRPKKIDGRRFTDKETLKHVVRVLSDEIHTPFVKQLKQLGGIAVSSKDVLTAKVIDPKLGRVGQVTKIRRDLVYMSSDSQLMLVLPSLAKDDEGNWLNINADDAAMALAADWKADVLVFVTDTPGVLASVDDSSTRLKRLSTAQAKKLIKTGVIAGGMVPKVEGCIAALQQGVKKVQILDGRVHHALLWETLSGECSGTEFVK